MSWTITPRHYLRLAGACLPAGQLRTLILKDITADPTQFRFHAQSSPSSTRGPLQLCANNGHLAGGQNSGGRPHGRLNPAYRGVTACYRFNIASMRLSLGAGYETAGFHYP